MQTTTQCTSCTNVSAMYPVYTIYVLYNMSHNTYVSLAAHQKLIQGQTALQVARYSIYTYSQHAIATYYTHVQSHKTKCLSSCLCLAIYCACLTPFIHCPGSCTPCCSANCSARSPLPVCFTACTTVCHVRGRSPVPFSWPSHLSSSRKRQVSTSELSLLIPSMTEDFTYRYVPNNLHWASN